MTHRFRSWDSTQWPRITIANRTADMATIAAFVDRVGTEGGIDEDCADTMNIVLDELLNNVISYGYPDGAVGQVEVALWVYDGQFCAEITDDAAMFDPTTAPETELSCDLSERAVGGLGLRFVQSLTEDMSYERRGETNVIRLCLRRKV